MTNNNTEIKQQLTEVKPTDSKLPDEIPMLNVEAKCVIWDPESKVVIVEGRG